MSIKRHTNNGRRRGVDRPTTMAYLMLVFAEPITGDTRGGTVVVPIHGLTPGVLARLTNTPMHNWYQWLLGQSSGAKPALELMEPLTLDALMGIDEPDRESTRHSVDGLVSTRECITASITMDAPAETNGNRRGPITRSVYQLTLPAPDHTTMMSILGMENL